MITELTIEDYKNILEVVYKDLGVIPATHPGTLSAIASLREKVFLALNPRMRFDGPCGHKVHTPTGKIGKSECSICGAIYLVEDKHDTLEITQIGKAE